MATVLVYQKNGGPTSYTNCLFSLYPEPLPSGQGPPPTTLSLFKMVGKGNMKGNKAFAKFSLKDDLFKGPNGKRFEVTYAVKGNQRQTYQRNY